MPGAFDIYTKQQIDAKAAAILPDTTGATAGQVLGLNSNLEPAWINGGGGQPTQIDISASTITSTATTSTVTRQSCVHASYSSNMTYRIQNCEITCKSPSMSSDFRTSASQLTVYDNTTMCNDIITWLNTNLSMLPDGNYKVYLSGYAKVSPTTYTGLTQTPLEFNCTNGSWSLNTTLTQYDHFIYNPTRICGIFQA